jgi:ribose transport system ATP-binding protein
VRFLSGGNQQKVVIAKWMSTEPDILLMDEPTAGVDIGTKSEIIEMIRQLASERKGVIIVSSEINELLLVSDRILVMRKGQMSQELDRSEIHSEEKLHAILQGA